MDRVSMAAISRDALLEAMRSVRGAVCVVCGAWGLDGDARHRHPGHARSIYTARGELRSAAEIAAIQDAYFREKEANDGYSTVLIERLYKEGLLSDADV